MMNRRVAGVVAVLVLAVGGCAVRLGGPKPQTYTAVALVDAGGDPAAVANQLKTAGADVALLSSPADSAWFAEVARQAQLTLSGPGHTGPARLALLSRLKVLGDTALALTAGSGRLHVMDALYEVDKNRNLDLMLMQIGDSTPAREAVRSLLSYYATDVGGTSAVLLALRAPTPQAADSAALLLRSAFGNVLDCEKEKAGTPAPAGTLRFFYGPPARIECERGRLTSASPPTIVGRVVVGR
jgi:hypothetical protein